MVVEKIIAMLKSVVLYAKYRSFHLLYQLRTLMQDNVLALFSRLLQKRFGVT